MNNEKYFLENLLNDENTENTDFLLKRKKKIAFAEFEKIIMNFIETGMLPLNENQISNIMNHINEEFDEILSWIGNIFNCYDEEDDYDYQTKPNRKTKYKLDNFLLYTKFKALEHMYQLKRSRMTDEKYYLKALDEVEGLETVILIVEQEPYISVNDIKIRSAFSSIAEVFKILNKGEIYFVLEESEEITYVYLSRYGSKMYEIIQKKTKSVLSLYETEQIIYKNCLYILNAFEKEQSPAMFNKANLDGLSATKQRFLKNKYLCAYSDLELGKDRIIRNSIISTERNTHDNFDKDNVSIRGLCQKRRILNEEIKN